MALDVPIVLTSLNERYRNWYRSAHRASPAEIEALQAFCAQANLSEPAFALPDVREYPYFANDPAVTGPQKIVFFSGAGLGDPDDRCFSTLRLIGSKPPPPGIRPSGLA